MGSYSSLYVNDTEIYSVKNSYDPAIMLLFTETDKHLDVVEDPDIDPDSPGIVMQYSAPLVVIQGRLNYYGYTRARAIEDFERAKQKKLDELETGISSVRDLQEGSRTMEAVLTLRELMFDSWSNAFREVVEKNLGSIYLFGEDDYSDERIQDVSQTVMFVLSHHFHFSFSFPFEDVRSFIAAVCESGLDGRLTYDFSDLVYGELIDPEATLADYARRDFTSDAIVNAKVIVLTEGKSDSWILKRAMSILYPHMLDYYSFMDFDAVRSPGSAASLVSVIKAFVGAGVVNRTIAIFDNDTAAKVAMRGLSGIDLPRNMRVITYPRIDLADSYPTLGPQGPLEMNVNGLAGSIELYLGEDVLRDEQGVLSPVQWRGYDEATNQYQGELLGKRDVLKRYRQKVKNSQGKPIPPTSTDWRHLRCVLDSIFRAFDDSMPGEFYS